uniref:Uncharacterized protein n=1 Tax=Anopheles culicifacies TaxID=139723 RepID=A0A182MRV2_9DIPT
MSMIAGALRWERLKCGNETVQLISQPEIGKTDVKEWRCHHAADRFQQPKPCLVAKHAQRIDEEYDHDHGHEQWINVRRYAQAGAVQKAQQTERPHHTEDGRHLHQMLLGQMVTRIKLEDEHVINAGRTPAIDIDADQKDKLNQQQRTPVEPESDLEILAGSAVMEDGRQDNGYKQHDEAATEQAHLEGRPRALLFAQRWYAQPLHSPLPIATLELGRNRRFRVIDQLVDVLVDEEVAHLDVLLLVPGTIVRGQYFVMLFQYLAKPGVVEVLIVLQQNEAEIELAEREL